MIVNFRSGTAVAFCAVVFWFANTQCASTRELISAKTPAPAFCTSSEFRQFDFWVGDWDVFDVDNPATKVARVHVDRILDGCVLRESYEGADGLIGQSLSTYDATREAWLQSWVTNRGHVLVIDGRLESGRMVLTGEDRAPTGEPRRVRGVWTPVDRGVRETAVRSTDSGKTWKPWFDLIFRQHKPESN